jgi:hypothetical protein
MGKSTFLRKQREREEQHNQSPQPSTFCRPNKKAPTRQLTFVPPVALNRTASRLLLGMADISLNGP